jgi:hypothetical protein
LSGTLLTEVSTAVAEYLAKFRSEDTAARLNEACGDQDGRGLAPTVGAIDQ